MRRITFVLISLVGLLNACGPVRFVKPLEKKQQALNLSLGGALIKKGSSTISIPFLTATYGYGIDSTVTAFGAINITSALFGNFQTELGGTVQVLKQHNYLPGLSTTPVINFICRNPQTYKFYPQLDINAYWEYAARKHYFYIGLSNWFELGGKQADDLSQTKRWLYTPLIGHNFNAAKWNVAIEVKVIAPNLSNEKNVVEYKTPFATHGALGTYVGYTYKF
jgi:hypothetical protein